MSSFENDSEYDSEYDSEFEDNYSDIVYDPGEPCITRFCVALCELYNITIHGRIQMHGEYIVNCRYKKLHMDWIHETAYFMYNDYQHLHTYYHNLFPNYRQIVLQDNYVKPEIVECIYKDGCCVAIIKTFWIKIIQRAWRNILKKREEIVNKRITNIAAIQYRQVHGKWPPNCYAKGGLIGLLKSTGSS
jgi:hypothetical protein